MGCVGSKTSENGQSAALFDMAKVLVLGATGFVGTATTTTLSTKGVLARVGARDVSSEKSKNLAKLPGITVVTGDMSKPDTLAGAMKNISTVLINTPGAENRSDLVAAAVNAAQAANVKHIVVVSIPSVEAGADILFKKQCLAIEAAVKSSGLKYTILRLPMFYENQWGNQGSIKGQAKIYSPTDPTKPTSLISVADIGEAIAAVLTAPSAHENKTYTLSSDTVTFGGIAKEFSEKIGQEVQYVQVPYPAAVEAMVGMGFPKWQAEGVCELMQLIDNEDPVAVVSTTDLESLLGHKPKSFKTWVDEVGDGFK